MPGDWSREEVEATVGDYFAMLAKELKNEGINKRAHNRALQVILTNRSPGAIEFKHANISAVLIELGYPYIEGYKPRANYQDLLKQVVADRLNIDHDLRVATESIVEQPVLNTPSSQSWDEVWVPVPRIDKGGTQLYEQRPAINQPRKGVNYLERESRNRSLGAAGEEFVLELEHRRLWQSGERDLAERVEHVSKIRGDGLGYDILSYETGGKERLIEVKTTRFGAMTPFFASGNEVEVSSSAGAQYHLYRLFKFSAQPKMYVLPGPLNQSVRLQPVLFRASLP